MREIQDGYEYILGPHNQPPPGEIHMFEISGETVTISPILDSEEETLKALDEKRKTVFGKNTPDADARGFLVRSPKKPGSPSWYAVHSTKIGPKNPLETISNVTGREVENY